MENISSILEGKIISAKNYEEILDFISFITDFPPRHFIHIQYLYFNGEINSYLANLKSKDFQLSQLNPNVCAFNYHINKKDYKIRGAFFVQPSTFSNLYAIYSISSSYNWSIFHQIILRRQYPRIVLLYWKQSEQTKALKLVEETLRHNYVLRVKKLSLKEKRENEKEKVSLGAKTAKAKFDSYLEWTNKTLSQVLDEAKERDQWFKKITFQLFKKQNEIIFHIPSAICKMSKFGYFSCNNLYPIIFPVVKKELEPPLKDRILLFKDRGLKERNYKPSSALTIIFEDEIFKNIDTFRYFSEIIKRYPNSTKAFFHTNPYFHASIADFLDGSSIDLWISNYKTVLLVPQIRTSISSLERLVAYIFDNFHEGIVEQYQSENE